MTMLKHRDRFGLSDADIDYAHEALASYLP